MIPSLPISTWLRLGAALSVILALAWSHHAAYRLGKTTVLSRLASDRISILKDGKEIDHEALNADDADLCRMLGGCGLSDE